MIMLRKALCAAALVLGLGLPHSTRASDVYVAHDDADSWAEGSRGTTHQRGDKYAAKKVLDLGQVSEAFWASVTDVRLSAFFCVRDYSWHDVPQPNGLDETLQIVVNGHLHEVPDRAGLPRYVEGKAMAAAMRWHDFALPRQEFVRGPNEIILRIVRPKDKTAPADDYLYLGIDNTVPTRRSWLQQDPKLPWRQDRLNSVGAPGEYMVRLYLLGGPRQVSATWLPGPSRTEDPQGLLEYAGADSGAVRLEWNPLRLDPCSPVSVTLQTAAPGPLAVQWLDAEGEKLGRPVKAQGPRPELRLNPPFTAMPGGVQFGKAVPLERVTLRAGRGYRPLPAVVQMVPPVEKPAGQPRDRRPSCRIEADKILLANDNLRCEFRRAGGRIQLASLYNELAAAEMVRRPGDCALAMIEIDGKRYSAAQDFTCRSVTPLPNGQGFSATLEAAAPGLEAVLSVEIDAALRWRLAVTNRAAKPAEFKIAFPHLAGLAISPEPADDYYFYPLGCTVSDAPALIRQGYGDHQALYQLMEIFSPARGAGLAVQCTDNDGRYKVLALRKCVPGRPEINADAPRTPTAEEFRWTNSLPSAPGVGITFEYLRRTRATGESFAPAEVALRAHAGDWHVAMRRYADWCHGVWKYRPYPSRLTPVLNMPGAGWGQSPLFRDGKYRTDYIKPRTDCIELMSWWEWAPLGPWRTPWDQLEARLGAANYKRASAYFVKDPVTGQTMYPLNRGDYDGYNRRWGGLPALREAIATYRRMGALVTLYTDPLLADDNTRCGQQWGKLWGIVNPDGKYRTGYEAWNICHDVADYRRFVAQTMGRVIRETGADGIRLDEYGHCGAACYSKLHQHTFAEWGTTEWQRAIAETTKMVHQAMDQAAPGTILTTEHPGYDFLMPQIEGCITYDLTVLASPLRPLECNLQRFYFPECKPFELDHRGADRQHRKRFWNAVGSFGTYYPPAMDAILRENAAVFSSRDCEPLVATLRPGVYANRFGAADRTFYTLYNAAGHSVVGALLSVQRGAGQHVVELLSGREVQCAEEAGGASARLFLARQDVACLACLPRRLSVVRNGDVLTVAVSPRNPRWQIALCGEDGKPLTAQPASEAPLAIPLSGLPKGVAAACVKLLDGPRMVDVCGLR
jgi:hypothetical protein